MSDAQAQRDESKDSQTAVASLRELNAKFLAEIAKLKKENDKIIVLEKKFAEVEAENAKLKQVIEENIELETRLSILEQGEKEKRIFMKDVSQYPVNFNDIPASNIPDNTSNSSITLDLIPELVQSSTEPELPATYLLQDVTDDNLIETLDFVETVYKEQVSNKIMERIGEKKF